MIKTKHRHTPRMASLRRYSSLPPRLPDPNRTSHFSFFTVSLALVSSLGILTYISLTPHLSDQPPPQHTLPSESSSGSLVYPLPTRPIAHSPTVEHVIGVSVVKRSDFSGGFGGFGGTQKHFGSNGLNEEDKIFHDKYIFLEDYKDMNRNFKIYAYPHNKDDPFAHALLPVDFEPGGNYASESYFKKVLMQSHFITKDPTKADLFFLPFSIARLRHDSRVGVRGIPDFIRNYTSKIRQNYPYWNRSDGADHFYVACHSTGRSAMEKAEQVKLNAIQVVCSSSYFLSGYIAHKDVSLPQIWPRQGTPPKAASSERKKLAFFAGSINSPVREKLLQAWRNDSDISINEGRLSTPYADGLLESKFCLQVKGFEVNTARIADALYYGCVPVIIANHYDLPFSDILNWKSFSVVVANFGHSIVEDHSEQYWF
ncbi:putative glycosyltransferase [Acorus calamus]|uniref:Glycosyltransferase n=1 Tax=Acorus calamus TaxID=4465 RepID=A0AAV9CI79_ACOCL|nr:putative glycosyltransferase [Acorus calamus]